MLRPPCQLSFIRITTYGRRWPKRPNDHFLYYWAQTIKDAVQETFYASYKHISIQCSHHTQRKGDKLDALNIRKKLVVKIRGRRPSLEGNPFRLIGRHFLILIPPTDKQDKLIRRCVVCHKHKQRKESKYLCRQYNEPFCVVPCLERYHTLKQY